NRFSFNYNALAKTGVKVTSSQDNQIQHANDQPRADSQVVPNRNSALLEATNVYGPLLVAEGEFDSEADVRPWSAWWLPVRSSYLFKGENGEFAPLEKYDKYRNKRMLNVGTSNAAGFEREHFYDPDAAPWEGLCNAWATAAVLEREPRKPLTLGDLILSVGDLKALLIKTYESAEGLEYFGQRYDGDSASVYDDIYPDQFHKIIQAVLFEQHRSFIIDKEPGMSVWNIPIWKAHTKIERDSADGRILHVRTWLTGASPFIDDIDYVGTLPLSFEYVYDLYGIYQGDGIFNITHGVWMGPSVDFHPDFVTVMGEKIVHKSRNIEVENSVVSDLVSMAGF
ncbi:MAG: hypothetical protein AABZ06_00640, partial [Bdellovibrionota bacterium]